MPTDQIVIHGAREHNLKNVDLSIPRDKLVVFSGLSGSGKSSLAFDTIYAEGQRRYVESLSAYARQFLGQMEKPDVDTIEGLSPAISIDQKGTNKNPRSTVGTVTEIYDYLRLLYARIGHPHCPVCGREVARQTTEQMADTVEKMGVGSKLMILGPVVKGRKGEYKSLIEDMRKSGFVRIRVDGSLYEIGEAVPLDKNKKHDIQVVVDRIVVGPEQRTRLIESIETAARLGQGSVIIAPTEGGEELQMSQEFACPYDGTSVPEPEPRNFSFNNPHGACPACTGIGSKLVADEDLVVSDLSLSLAQGAIAPWAKSQFFYPELLAALAKEYGISMGMSWGKLTRAQKDIVMKGTGKKALRFYYESSWGGRRVSEESFEGVLASIQRRYASTDSDFVKEDLEKYMSNKPCEACLGSRLKPSSLAVTVQSQNIAEVCELSVEAARDFFAALPLTEREQLIARGILKEVKERLGFLHDVGLDYLTIARGASSLSGGESQRIRLASQIGSKLQGVTFCLDEPSIGLHQRDNRKLLNTLFLLRDLGNTVIVVEHDEETILAADFLVDIGPGAGEQGGEIVASGTVEEVMKSPKSLTAAFLRGDRAIPIRSERRTGNGKKLVVRGGAIENNLKNLDVAVPLGCLVGLAGVSGSGKSSFMTDILGRKLAQHFYKAREKPGKHKRIDGLEHIDKAITIDQSPIGRTPRSNPATYTGMFTYIRDLFATMPESKVRGYKAGRFSFNVRGGRCEACQGDGLVQIEMHFLPDVYVPCEVCSGTRFARETLEVKFHGKSIADVLDLTVEEALGVFENVPRIKRKLRTLHDVGLGYVKLGQPATQLSGGEAQRVKLSTELSRRDTGKTIYLLDEPTTGLHFADVERLLEVLHRLVDNGNTVLIIEHNLAVLATADWIIDLGPEGGEKGGYIMAAGTPEQLVADEESVTGEFLKPILAKAQMAGKRRSALSKRGEKVGVRRAARGEIASDLEVPYKRD